MDSQSSLEGPPARGPSLILGALLGALTILPTIALDYLGAQIAGLPFVPFDIFDWLARVLPGGIITFGIDTMVRLIRGFSLGPTSATAKSMEQAMGVVLVIAAGAVIGFLIALGLQRTRWSGATIGAVLGVLLFAFDAGIEMALGSEGSGNSLGALIWIALLDIGWAILLGRWLGAREFAAPEPSQTAAFRESRRDLLVRLAGGSLALAFVATGIGRLLEAQQAASGAGQSLSTLLTPTPPPGNPSISAAPSVTPESTPMPQETAAATVRDRLAPAPGTRAEVTANKDWYRTDIDTLPPVIDKASWGLTVKGLFDRPRTMMLADFTAYPAVEQPLTMACISNPVGGDLISTGTWTGVRAKDVLKDLGLSAQAVALEITSADGFYESVPVEELMDPRTLFVYGMNGTTLPVEHGFPLRIYIPNHYGMKQPKWIVSMEAINRDGRGYWVDRGWSATAVPQINSVIDTIAKNNIQDGKVPLGGIAWAGDRGIKKVEVQVDNGPWVEAALRTPPLSPLTWVQWRYDWPVVRGSHTFRVRATDGSGTLQPEQESDTYPDGATGYHSVRETV